MKLRPSSVLVILLTLEPEVLLPTADAPFHMRLAPLHVRAQSSAPGHWNEEEESGHKNKYTTGAIATIFPREWVGGGIEK